MTQNSRGGGVKVGKVFKEWGKTAGSKNNT